MPAFGTVTGQIFDFIDTLVVPASTVVVVFTPSVSFLTNVADDDIILLNESWIPVNNDGTFSANLVATDDTSSNPVNWTYTVKFTYREKRTAKRPEGGITFPISVLSNTTLNLADIVPVDTSPGVITIQGPPGPHPDREYPVYWLPSSSTWETRPNPLPEGYDRAIFKSFFDASATNPVMVAGDIWWKSVV